MSTTGKTKRNALLQLLVAAGLPLSLASCSGPSSSVTISNNGEAAFALSLPDMLMTRAVVESNLVPSVTINDIDLSMTKSGTNWSGNTSVAEGSDVTIEVLWTEIDVPTSDGPKPLRLAKYSQIISDISSSETLVITSADYVTNTPDLDEDNDSYSNLTERREDTDAFDAESPAASTAMVNINNNDPGRPPEIDGTYDSAIWGGAQFLDTDGQVLKIDNLMVLSNSGVSQGDGEPNYQWAALHDERYLYLLVLGEETPLQTPFGDSARYFEDDSVEIFWDGDHSKGTSYDKVDDIHIVIPLLKENASTLQPNRSGESDSRIQLGANSSPFDLDAVKFATCVCLGARSLWEIRIDLAEAKIPIGVAFGFEVQLNDDVDGGARDGKWGWFHPPRAGDNSDTTWQIPSVMGDVRLKPFPG